jgi:hypothetical protein
MAGKSMASLYFAGAGFLEPFSSSPVRLDFGHLFYPPLND